MKIFLLVIGVIVAVTVVTVAAAIFALYKM
jgi:hypothetical protein